jgi:hypothetical protein
VLGSGQDTPFPTGQADGCGPGRRSWDEEIRMTRHESFKRRIRERMSETGERYGAARRTLLAQAGGRPGGRPWVAEPEQTDEAVRAATGRGWDEWCDIVDAWPGHDGGHTAVAAHLVEVHGVAGWWAQTVTLGWERITGRRVRHQMADGTFRADRTRTVTVDHLALREALLDDEARSDLFPGLETELRSKPTAKTLRVRVGPGVAGVHLDPKPGGRVTVSVSHEKLTSPDEVAEWKAWWGDWLDALDEPPTAPG